MSISTWMRLMRRLGAAVVVAAGLIAGGISERAAAADDPKADEPKQVKLDDGMLQGFLSAQKDVADLAQKNGAQPGEQADDKVRAELDAIAKKYGFATFAALDDVAFSISMIFHDLDPQTGVFVDPIVEIKKEIEDVKSNKTVTDEDRKRILEDLDLAMKNVAPLKFPENIEIVKKFRGEIAKIMQ